MRALAIDVGTVRLGLAVSDPLGISAQPLEVIAAAPFAKALEQLRRIIREKEVAILLIGLPLNMDGTEGDAAKMARDFGALLAPLGLPVEYVDERLSTAMAENALLEADLRRDRRKQVRDKVAATLILQSWLNTRVNPPRA